MEGNNNLAIGEVLANVVEKLDAMKKAIIDLGTAKTAKFDGHGASTPVLPSGEYPGINKWTRSLHFSATGN
ncbi:UNVERIFIED_CONTAM: hypothetical protein FKN15_068774 [Acipenser sinensis]